MARLGGVAGVLAGALLLFVALVTRIPFGGEAEWRAANALIGAALVLVPVLEAALLVGLYDLLGRASAVAVVGVILACLSVPFSASVWAVYLAGVLFPEAGFLFAVGQLLNPLVVVGALLMASGVACVGAVARRRGVPTRWGALPLLLFGFYVSALAPYLDARPGILSWLGVVLAILWSLLGALVLTQASREEISPTRGRVTVRVTSRNLTLHDK